VTAKVSADGSAEQHMRIEKMDANGAHTESLAGVELVYTQSPRGQITSRQVSGGTATQTQIMKGVMNSLDQVVPVLPEKSVNPGDSWSDHRTIEMSAGMFTMKMAVDSTYTLREIHGTKLVLGVAVAMTMPDAVKVGDDVSLKGDGTVAGSVNLDLAGGEMESTADGDMTMEITVKGNAQQMQMHYTITQVKAP
jgi:hypothetical protein